MSKKQTDKHNWTDAFTSTPGLPAAVTTPEVKRGSVGARVLQPASLTRDPYVWVDPFAAEKPTQNLTTQFSAKTEKAPPPSVAIFTPARTTKRTVVFILDGSGSSSSLQANGASLLNNHLAAVQLSVRDLLRRDPTHPAYKIMLFGDTKPFLLDPATTRSGGLISGTLLAPTLHPLSTIAGQNPDHMLHIVVLGNGDVFDLAYSAAAIESLLAKSTRVSLDIMVTANRETTLAKLAQSFAHNPRVMLTTATATADPRRLAKTLQQRLARRLSAPLPPLKQTPAAKKTPVIKG